MQLFLASSVNVTAESIMKRMRPSLEKRKLIFITTASEAEEGDKQWLADDRNSLIQAGFRVEDYTITGKTYQEIKQKLMQFDVICVAGGNTFYLLEKTIESKFDKVCRELVQNGIPYIGSSAGSLLAGPDIEMAKTVDNANKAPNLKNYKSIGLTDVIILPHWGNPFCKDLYLNQRLEQSYKRGNKIILLNDDQYVHVKESGYEIVDITKNY
jgi:dipeptidase E